MTDETTEDWTDRFKSDVARFFGIDPEATIVWVDPQVQVFDPDEPCETCKFSWFAVEVGFKMPDGRVVEETHRGDMGQFLAAVASNVEREEQSR